MTTPERVAVFLDWQNVYRGAREVFFPPTAYHTKGQVDPMGLGKLIAARAVTRVPRVLHQVRAYTGRPGSAQDPRGYGANRRQTASWERDGVIVTTRQLRYPRGYPGPGIKPQEKGIDVQLAVDFVMMKFRDEYDVGILFSADTDLLPALEEVARLALESRTSLPEVCAWGEPGKGRSRLRISGSELRCHWLAHRDYRAVEDQRDYNIPS